jgi:hypothetical protein
MGTVSVRYCASDNRMSFDGSGLSALLMLSTGSK